jgi:hypothetical protein
MSVWPPPGYLSEAEDLELSITPEDEARARPRMRRVMREQGYPKDMIDAIYPCPGH